MPTKVASHMTKRELEYAIHRMTDDLNRYLKRTPLYKQPEYISKLKDSGKGLFKTVRQGKNRRKYVLFRQSTSGMTKDQLIERFGWYVMAIKSATRQGAKEKGIDTLKQRLSAMGLDISKKDLTKILITMNLSGIREYEDSEQIMQNMINYVNEGNEINVDSMTEYIKGYIEEQAENQDEISTKDLFEKLKKEQSP